MTDSTLAATRTWPAVASEDSSQHVCRARALQHDAAQGRRRDLSPSLRLLLGVDNLWCDTRTEQSAQKFVLWAGHVLQHRAAFEVAAPPYFSPFSSSPGPAEPCDVHKPAQPRLGTEGTTMRIALALT